METETIKGTIKTAFGRPLSSYRPNLESLDFEGPFIALNADEIRAKGDWPNEAKIVKFYNDEKKAARRAELIAAKLEDAGIKKPEKDDPLVVLQGMYDNLMLTKKYSKEQARKLASDMTGTAWPE